MDSREPKPVEWVASSKVDLKGFPVEVRDHVGFALYQAQIGLKHRDAKPLSGMSPGFLEAVSRLDKDTFRAVCTVRFAEVVYVLHAFQKKSKKGIATPQREMDIVRARLRAAEQHDRETYDRAENP